MKITIEHLQSLLKNQGAKAVTLFARAAVAEHNRSSNEFLFLAIWSEHLEMLGALLEAGLDVNVFNRVGATPLYYASAVGFPDREQKQHRVCELLIQRGADVNLQHRIVFDAPPKILNGDTALMVAARTGAISIVKLLLSSGAKPLLKDDQGFCAYDHALRSGKSEISKLLKPTPSQ